MKLRVIDRILAAVAGLALVLMAIPPLVDSVFKTPMLAKLGEMAQGGGSAVLLVFLALAVLALGGACIHLAVRRRKGKGFVVQNNDMGEVSISIRALEGLVARCVEKHEELHVTSTLLENTRDGLVIKLCANMASGVNIPKAVSTLQKQIKQYVSTCSGVDVYEVRVQVDATAAKGNPSVYAVPDMLENPAPLPREETAAEPPAEIKEPEEKCLHQRLFGEEEQPAIVPMPPVEPCEEAPVPAEDAAEEAGEPEAAAPSDESCEAWEENVPADEQIAQWDAAAESADEAEEAAEEVAEENDLPEADEVADGESLADLAALDGADPEEVVAAESAEEAEEAEPAKTPEEIPAAE